MKEFPLFEKRWKKGMKKLAIVYPNLYYGGVYCIGPLTVYNLVNQRASWLCERRFLDSEEKDLSQFDLIGFSLQYELDYYNFGKILKANKIPLAKETRKEIIFAGGPCVTSNPHTLEKYIDFFFIGECEEVFDDVLAVYETTPEKEAFLEAISKIKGIYVPGRNTPIAVEADLSTAPYPLYQPLPEEMDKRFVFGNAFLLEIERGCPFRCNFCTIPKIYQSLRFRPFDKIKEILDQGLALNKRTKVAIYSPSFVHPQRKEVLQYLLEKGIRFSVPSTKIEYVDEELLHLIKRGGARSFTVAPECGETLRPTVGKNVKDERFLTMFQQAERQGLKTIKMYYIIGLPGQDEKDFLETQRFIEQAKQLYHGAIYLSVNALVPKPRTPWEGLPYNKSILKQQQKKMQQLLGNKVRMKFSNINTSYHEWQLANAKELALEKYC